tara:strand:+ start:18979 stop:19977 length:999 start_codon:yes stop_codon:yes gene_type:complete
MIVARAPYRVSFFGGGTDYPEWYSDHGGCFLSLAINHYCYITLRVKPPFQEKRYRVSWRIAEDVSDIKFIKHPIVRHSLENMKVNSGLDITYTGDLPGGSGLGSSSAFTVALNHSLHAANGYKPNQYELANEAYEIERIKLEEIIGIQDQIATAFGGFNHVVINRNGTYVIEKILLTKLQLKKFLGRIILVYTGISRLASSVAEKKVKNIKQKTSIVSEMQDLVGDARSLLTNERYDEFGKLLHKNWLLKKSISSVISTDVIDDIYDLALKNGAIGGKLLGAGAGGFMLFFCKEGEKENLSKIFESKMIVPFEVCDEGSKIVFEEEKNYGIL